MSEIERTGAGFPVDGAIDDLDRLLQAAVARRQRARKAVAIARADLADLEGRALAVEVEVDELRVKLAKALGPVIAHYLQGEALGEAQYRDGALLVNVKPL